MYENSDKFVLNRKSRFSHFEVCCSYTFIKKPERNCKFFLDHPIKFEVWPRTNLFALGLIFRRLRN
jgi:hypothetical protein